MKPRKPDEIVSDEATKFGRPCELVAGYVFSGVESPVTFVVYDVEPYEVEPGAIFRQRRWAVDTPSSNGGTARSGGIVTTSIDRAAADA